MEPEKFYISKFFEISIKFFEISIKNFFQFNRATTSQLIKWFSNFREFFYIQVRPENRKNLETKIL